MKKKKILIIDDDDLMRTLISQFVNLGGYDVITAAEGHSGIALYQSENPDLVVLDMAMPGMSGFDVAAGIRSVQNNENRPHTPIVILTAYARSFFVSAGGDSRVDSFMRKPITSDEFLQHIDQFLGEASL